MFKEVLKDICIAIIFIIFTYPIILLITMLLSLIINFEIDGTVIALVRRLSYCSGLLYMLLKGYNYFILRV